MNNLPNKLYILTNNNESYRQHIRALALPDLTITEERHEANILLAAPPLAAQQLNSFPQLKWLQSIYAGVDALLHSSQRRDYQLTNIKGIFGQAITEYILGYTIAHYRHFSRYQQQQTEQRWQAHPYTTLTSKRMTILGTGSIGHELAQKARAMGLNVVGVNTLGISPDAQLFEHVYPTQELTLAVSIADVIVNTLPDTPDTYHLLNNQTLQAAQQALLFNVGRGSAICQSALLNALEKGNIEHAYLDVFEKEPLEPDHPYWQHNNITLTPHIAALSAPEQVINIFAANYLRWQDAQPLHGLINFSKGY